MNSEGVIKEGNPEKMIPLGFTTMLTKKEARLLKKVKTALRHTALKTMRKKGGDFICGCGCTRFKTVIKKTLYICRDCGKPSEGRKNNEI